MKIYAELARNCKKYRIKSRYDNKLNKEFFNAANNLAKAIDLIKPDNIDVVKQSQQLAQQFNKMSEAMKPIGGGAYKEAMIKTTPKIADIKFDFSGNLIITLSLSLDRLFSAIRIPIWSHTPLIPSLFKVFTR